jgi:hypothetical protein
MSRRLSWTLTWTPSQQHFTCEPGDLQKAAPDRAPWRPVVGIVAKISDAEMVTLAVMQALLGHSSEAHWPRYARARLRHLSPDLPKHCLELIARAARLQQAAAAAGAPPSAGWSGCWPATPRCGPTTSG